jgi:hypothetical protein
MKVPKRATGKKAVKAKAKALFKQLFPCNVLFCHQ